MDSSPGMRAMQILQTVMLTGMLGTGAWSLGALVRNGNALARMEPELERVAEKQEYVLKQIDNLKESDQELRIAILALDKRITIIENKK